MVPSLHEKRYTVELSIHERETLNYYLYMARSRAEVSRLEAMAEGWRADSVANTLKDINLAQHALDSARLIDHD